MSLVRQDDVFSYRLQLFDLAGRIGVLGGLSDVGIHGSTYYAWKC
jgi:hypothetical protein